MKHIRNAMLLIVDISCKKGKLRRDPANYDTK